jgi:hypothetical protein
VFNKFNYFIQIIWDDKIYRQRLHVADKQSRAGRDNSLEDNGTYIKKITKMLISGRRRWQFYLMSGRYASNMKIASSERHVAQQYQFWCAGNLD